MPSTVSATAESCAFLLAFDLWVSRTDDALVGVPPAPGLTHVRLCAPQRPSHPDGVSTWVFGHEQAGEKDHKRLAAENGRERCLFAFPGGLGGHECHVLAGVFSKGSLVADCHIRASLALEGPSWSK